MIIHKSDTIKLFPWIAANRSEFFRTHAYFQSRLIIGVTVTFVLMSTAFLASLQIYEAANTDRDCRNISPIENVELRQLFNNGSAIFRNVMVIPPQVIATPRDAEKRTFTWRME